MLIFFVIKIKVKLFFAQIIDNLVFYWIQQNFPPLMNILQNKQDTIPCLHLGIDRNFIFSYQKSSKVYLNSKNSLLFLSQVFVVFSFELALPLRNWIKILKNKMFIELPLFQLWNFPRTMFPRNISMLKNKHLRACYKQLPIQVAWFACWNWYWLNWGSCKRTKQHWYQGDTQVITQNKKLCPQVLYKVLSREMIDDWSERQKWSQFQ